MRGILKSNHRKFQDSLQHIKAIEKLPDNRLRELEDEFLSLFREYEQKMDEIRLLINVYYEKQKLIINEIKRAKKKLF